jgi:p-aminobenzoyl-glutamate transporter AbgT
MMSYFGIIFAFACRYDRKLGIGTLIATMLPYSILFLVGWIALFYVYVFLLGCRWVRARRRSMLLADRTYSVFP